MTFDPKLDLKLERVVDVAPELVWKAWTDPEHIKPWFCPRPWQTVEVEIDLRPGGRFRTVMQSPEGERFPGDGCYLEVVPNRRLVWTSALGPGFRPQPASKEAGEACGDLLFTAFIILEPHGAGGTKYTAIVIHPDESSRRKHAEMGFEQGWGACLTQLVEYVKGFK